MSYYDSDLMLYLIKYTFGENQENLQNSQKNAVFSKKNVYY